MNLLRSFIDRFGSKDTEVEAENQRLSRVPDAAPIAEVTPRMRTTIAGVITSVTRSLADESPRLDITISDGTGTAKARFLGRREIPGINVGRVLALHSCFGSENGKLLGLNPEYRLCNGSESSE